MKKLLLLLLLCAGCAKTPSDQSDTIVSMQIIDRNGFTETISNKDRLSPYQAADFTEPQPYQKILRVYGRSKAGQSTSKITSYHENGGLWQYLEVMDGRAHGTYQEWFANGKQKLQVEVIEGVADIHQLAQATWIFHGPSQVWDEEGNLVAQFYYEKGVLHTEALYFFADGSLQKSIPYLYGEINGIAQTFNERGEVIEEVIYVNGEREGKATSYWELGTLKSEELYTQDKLLSGLWFDLSGNPVAEVKEYQGKQAVFEGEHLHALFTITDGILEGEMQFFHPDGSLLKSHVIREGKKNGEEWEYYPQTAQPKLLLHWADDKIQGHVKTWYANGQIESQREINNNKKQGTCFAWYKNGDLMLMEEYENNLLVKGTYYKKGDKKAVSKIDSGKGVASLYTAEGIFVKKVNYEKGRPLLVSDAIP